MINFVKPGHVQTITAPSGGTTSGVGVLLGNLFGVAQTTNLVGESCEIAVEGTFNLAKTSALAIAVGDLLYWDNTNKVVNKTASAQKLVGICVLAAANPSAAVWIMLVPNVTAAA